MGKAKTRFTNILICDILILTGGILYGTNRETAAGLAGGRSADTGKHGGNFDYMTDETYTVNMDIIYKGKEGPEPEGYGIETLPGLRSLKIKHMKSKAEASDELGGIYDYMMSDILEESVRKDSHTVRYTRWDHLEEGNFHLFFETYCREITDGDVVETEVEKGRDIELLVEDERVEVDCHKDIGYFLFAEDLSNSEYKAPVAWEHLLNNGYTDTKELRWLKDGNRFAVGIWEEPNSFNGWSAFYLGDEARKQLKGK